tara:strand:- start:246981 stop:247484 length:504 start_codon:yes stop_codon:yes gene_type:complete
MKKLIIALSVLGFFTVGADAAYAYECNYLLKNSVGQTVKVVKGRDYYSQSSACVDAKRDCEMLRDRSYSYGMYCTPEYNGGYGNGGYGNGGYGNGGYGNGGYGNGGYGNRSCAVELVDRWGYRIQTFYSSSYGGRNGGPQVCRDALRDCNKYKTDYNYHGARCETRR